MEASEDALGGCSDELTAEEKVAQRFASQLAAHAGSMMISDLLGLPGRSTTSTGEWPPPVSAIILRPRGIVARSVECRS